MGSKDLEVLMKMQDAKNLPKIRYLRTIARIYWDISSQLWHISTIGKKTCCNICVKSAVKPQPTCCNISFACPLSMVSVGEIGL